MQIHLVSNRDTADVDAELPAPVTPVLDFSGRVVRGRYRLRRRVGCGGMGAVYEALDLVLGSPVAVKLIHPELARDPEFRRRFLQEARLGAELRHRHSVAVSDVGETDDGVLFSAMELLEGKSLDAVLAAEGPLPWRRVCTIVGQLCAALAEAHRRGVVHRDIKPANCFLVRTEGGGDFVKLLDLGLAKLLPPDRGLARAPTGASPRVVGTPEYMSPEQALGRPLDHRVDIYALGVTMYKLLTGRLPFAGSPPGVLLRRHVGETPRPLREVAPDIELPAALEAAVLRALAKSPEARFQGVAELAQALRAAEELAGSPAQPSAPESSALASADGGPSALVAVTVRAPVVPAAGRFETRRAAAGLGAAGLVLALAAIATAIHVLGGSPPPAPPPAAPVEESPPKLSLGTGARGHVPG